MKSPVGELKLVAGPKGLIAILWENDGPNRVRLASAVRNDEDVFLKRVEQQLTQYFEGCRKRFDLPLDFCGTEFQKSVWNALLQIPYGETTSYGEFAKKLHKPRASRAVGAANAKNPISIIAACHRVVAAKGALTGFAGGLGAKKYLLEHEAQSTSSRHPFEAKFPKLAPRYSSQ